MKITKIDVERTVRLTKTVAKQKWRLRALWSRKRNLLVCKLPTRMEKIKATNKYSLIGIAEFGGVQLHSETSCQITRMSNMHLIYGQARRSGPLSQRIYQERYQRSCCRCDTTFTKIDRRVREMGSFETAKCNIGYECSVCTSETENRICNGLPFPCCPVCDSCSWTLYLARNGMERFACSKHKPLPGAEV